MTPLFHNNFLKSRESIKDKNFINKNMVFTSSAEKSVRLKTLSFQEDLKRERIKSKKFRILQKIKVEKETKLLEKFRKFELRQNKYVIIT